MHVSIHSEAVGGRTKGKTSWGFVWDLKKNAEVSRPHVSGSIGGHPWAIILRDTTVHEVSSGIRTGARLEVEARVVVELTPADVVDLVNLAFEMGLVNVQARTEQ